MSANNKRDDFRREDLLDVARNMGIKNALSIVDQTVEIVANWYRYASEAGIKEAHKEQISKNLRVMR